MFMFVAVTHNCDPSVTSYLKLDAYAATDTAQIHLKLFLHLKT